jgi:hypothetical protein
LDTAGSPLTRALRSGWTALLLFAGLSLFVTWPLATGLGRDVPGDYGDPLYVAWALAWVSRQTGLVLTGHLDALTGFWRGNQLHPEPAALALSDSFIGQALPLMPVYWATENALLVLGLAYLMAFTLAGFCTWLLVRELTGSAAAGVVAGSTFAFNPNFLVFELVHLQVVSAWGMPLVLYGLRRYFARDATSGLWVAGSGMVMLSLSSGYYMVMFPLFVVLYVAWELSARGRWRDAATWRALVATGAGILLVMAPVLWPYLAARQRLGFARSVEETTRMAATIDGYQMAVLPMVVPFVLATVALVGWAVRRLSLALGRGSGALAERRGAGAPDTQGSYALLGFALSGAVLAFWLSLGPIPSWSGETYPSLGLYRLLQDYLPGMNILRVSSRFSVVFVLFLAMLAGAGAAALARGRAAAAVIVVAGVLSAALNTPARFPMNGDDVPTVDVLPAAGYLRPDGTAPEVYRYVASLPRGTVIAELPFTELWHNTRYLYFSTFHWHPLVNGFTSFFPPDYMERVKWLVNPVRTPDEAWQAIVSGGATHVIVHREAWRPDYVAALDAWLTSHGARRHGDFEGATVYEVAGSP